MNEDSEEGNKEETKIRICKNKQDRARKMDIFFQIQKSSETNESNVHRIVSEYMDRKDLNDQTVQNSFQNQNSRLNHKLKTRGRS